MSQPIQGKCAWLHFNPNACFASRLAEDFENMKVDFAELDFYFVTRFAKTQKLCFDVIRRNERRACFLNSKNSLRVIQCAVSLPTLMMLLRACASNDCREARTGLPRKNIERSWRLRTKYNEIHFAAVHLITLKSV